MISLFRANKFFIKEFFRSGRLYLLLQLLAMLLVVPINYITTYAPKFFIDNVTVDEDLRAAMQWIIVWSIVKLIDQNYRHFLDLVKKRSYFRAKIASKRYMYEKIEFIHLTYFENPENLNDFNNALNYNESGGEAFVNLVITVVSSVLTFATMAYISMQFEWWLWIIIIALVCIQFFTDRYMKKMNVKFNIDRAEKNRKQNYFNGLPTNKTSIAEIKVNSKMSFFFSKYKESFEENRIFQETHEIKNYSLSFLFSLPGELFVLFCYWLIGTRLIGGVYTIGDYTLFFVMINTINSHLRIIIKSINMFYEQSLQAKVCLKFIDNKQIFAVNHVEANESVLSPFELLEMKNVSFHYPGQSIPALKNVSLKIHRGDRISLVGYNGAGKTTFIKLLAFLFEPTEGDICYNGQSLSRLDAKQYWSKIGIVFQNHQEFSMSIKDNILLRDAEIDDEEQVWDALSKVGLIEKINKTSKKIDLQLTKNFYKDGMDFSGGERQKIAIARALAKNSDIYIFDEPSSALDPKSEDQLYQCIASIPKEKTVIMISHRLSSVFMTDRIIFFKDGEVLADGSHEALINTCPDYRELYETQAKKFKVFN